MPDGHGSTGAKRRGPTSQAGQSGGGLPCAEISVVGVALQRHSGGGGPCKVAAPLCGISGDQTTRAESSEAKVVAGALVSFPKTCQKNRILNMIRLIQLQWGRGGGRCCRRNLKPAKRPAFSSGQVSAGMEAPELFEGKWTF